MIFASHDTSCVPHIEVLCLVLTSSSCRERQEVWLCALAAHTWGRQRLERLNDHESSQMTCAVPQGDARQAPSAQLRKEPIVHTRKPPRRFARTAPEARNTAPKEHNLVDAECGPVHHKRRLETLCTTINVLTHRRIPFGSLQV